MTWTSLAAAAAAIRRSPATIRRWIAEGRMRFEMQRGDRGRRAMHVVLEEAQALAGVLHRGRPRTRGPACETDGCGRKVLADGKCRRCYRRARKGGA